MKAIQMVDLYHQYLNIKDEVDAAMNNVINSCSFINGMDTKLFANELQEYLGVNHAIPCGNGTDALQIALMALELEAGDEIITTPFTFIATAEVIELLKLKPVFVDVCPNTYLMDLNEVESKITNRTKVIIPVHLFGQAVNMEELKSLASKHNLYVVEDGAQAIGAKVKIGDQTKSACAIGDIGCTSFFPSKNLGCFGDGGAIFTNSNALAEKIRMIINHGSKVKYYHEVVGVNSRLDTIQAAILRVKLRKLDEFINNRQKAARIYDNNLAKIESIQVPARVNWSEHVFHQYTMVVKGHRDELRAYLADSDIPSMIYYPIPLHLQQAYAYLNHKEGDFPISESLSKNVLSLPMHTELEMDQLQFICRSIEHFFNGNY